MGQQQFRILSSIGTRLLVSTVCLLVAVIGFFNVSAILLMRQDKLASTYHAKSMEAVLAGREFTVLLDHVLESLRVSLAVGESSVRPNVSRDLQALVENQPDAVMISTYMSDLESGSATLAGQAMDAKELAEARVQPEEVGFAPVVLKSVLPALRKDPYELLNMSRPGGPAILGVIVADSKRKTAGGPVPVAAASVLLHRFSAHLSGLQVTIASRDGQILYNNDPAINGADLRKLGDPLFLAALGNRTETPGNLDFQREGQRFLGSYVSPGRNLVVMTRINWSDAIAPAMELTAKFIVLGFFAILIGVVFAAMFARSLTAPINRLYEATQQVAGGNFRLRLKPEGSGEIRALTESFNIMSAKITDLFEVSVEKVLLESEVDIASTVQQTLIPPMLYRSEGIEIHSYYQAASRCGGDWWGVFQVGSRVCVAIGDATGHGLPSALITAAARSCMSVLNKRAEEDPGFSFSPNEMLSYANQVVYDSSLGNIMMTFVIGVIDLERKTFTYANAGHNPPWMFRKLPAGGFEHKSLVGVGMRLGESRSAPRYEERVVQVASGDMLFLYTDGLLEAAVPGGMPYGKKRSREMFDANLALGPERMIQALVADFNSHQNGKLPDDDVALALIRIT